MDEIRFDKFSRALATGLSRRAALKAATGGLLAAIGVRTAGAQVTQAQCGNKSCASNPGVCTSGCVCCGYSNGNSRCTPAGACTGGGSIIPVPTTTTTPAPTTTTTTTASPTTTTTTTTAAPLTCGGSTCAPAQDACLANGSCAEICFGGVGTCPSGCLCSQPSTEGQSHCIWNIGSCAEVPQVCASTADCPQGQHCQFGCGGDRCFPLCPTA